MTDTGSSPVKARTLEYKQAMKDFHIMFPTLERDTIECVLRSNAGHVDSTIDQLLQLTQDMAQNNRNIPGNHMMERFYLHGNDSSSSNESFPAELRGPPTSSDEDQPPRYTDYDPYSFSSHPVQPTRRFRDWNPPLLGTLPDDFLRIVSIKHPSPVAKVLPRQARLTPRRNDRAARDHMPHTSHPNRRGMQTSRSPSSRAPNSKTKLQRRKTTGYVDPPLKPTHSFHHSPQRRLVRVNEPQDRHPHHHPPHRRASAPASRSRQRGNDEQSQYIEDRRVALMLQNEEFLRELRRNEQFLQELNKGDAPSSNNKEEAPNTRETFRPISVNPLQELPSEKTDKEKNGHEPPPEDSKAFKESLKHMSKSTKKSFIELSRKFNARRKSYKSLNDTLDPVFANCKDD